MGRKIALTCVKVMLAAVVGIGICGVAAGIGVFRGILSSTPRSGCRMSWLSASYYRL